MLAVIATLRALKVTTVLSRFHIRFADGMIAREFLKSLACSGGLNEEEEVDPFFAQGRSS